MKERILYGWTFQRGFYLIAGIGLGGISLINGEWIGMAIGAYFASMGLFAFGCAGGNCYTEPGRQCRRGGADINKMAE